MEIKTAQQLANACINLAENYKTLYVMGCFGAPMNASNKVRYTKNHEYNTRAVRKAMIQAATADTFGFDCVCMIKGLLWGWSGDENHCYGGANYASKGVPDAGADQMCALCKDISTDFSRIEVGELLWLKGHVGIYVGDGNAVECTPGWKNCVQITAVRNIKSGNGHLWTKHGKLPYVAYGEDSASESERTESDDKTEDATVPEVTGLPMLKVGSKSETVRAAQILLIAYGYDVGVDGADGEFGANTRAAVVRYQKDNAIGADGIVGGKTWAKLLGM